MEKFLENAEYYIRLYSYEISRIVMFGCLLGLVYARGPLQAVLAGAITWLSTITRPSEASCSCLSEDRVLELVRAEFQPQLDSAMKREQRIWSEIGVLKSPVVRV